MADHYVDIDGNYLGFFDGITPDGGFVVPVGPDDPRQTWNFDDELWEGFVIPKDYKVWDYVLDYADDKSFYPSGISIETGLTQKLHPVHTFSGEQLASSIYYADAEDNLDGTFTYTNPIVQISYDYELFEDARLTKTELYQWYFDDDSLDTVQESRVQVVPDNPMQTEVRFQDGRVVNTLKRVGSPLEPDDVASRGYVDGLFEDVLSSVYFIPLDREITIPVYQQMINKGGLTIEGTLLVEGQLFLEE